ncbi:MAG: glycosyltransferase [Bacteroidetes bacterium]|nr:glycosyltransferase [Bacteroidota bacterium]
MSKKRIKVLFISSWFPNRIKPTLGNFVEKHAESVSSFVDVAILHVCFDNNIKTKKAEIIESIEKNIPRTIIYVKPPSGIFSGIRKIFLFTKYYKIGFKLITKVSGTPDIIHANVFFPIGIIAMMFKRKFHIPFVITEHWTGYHEADPNQIGFFNKYISKKTAYHASRILPVSNNLGMAMQKTGLKGNYLVVPNVVDTNLFQPKPQNTEENITKKIVHISSLDDKQKNVSGIMNTISELSRQRNDFELHIISDGDSTQLVDLCKSLNLLNDKVFFHGKMESDEIADFMKDAAFLLLFSNYENLPCVIAEAFAAGVPVLSTEVGGINEFFNDKLGILIKAGDKIALQNAMNTMLDKHIEFDKNHLHSYANENFSYQVIGEKLFNIYTETLKETQIG